MIAAGIATEVEPPARPWHQIQGTSDASTLWYAVLRKRTRGIFIGTLCIRHSDHHASLLAGGWEEVAVEEIGRALPGAGPANAGEGAPRADQAM